MKKMVLFIVFIAGISCSSYSIKTDFENSKDISRLKKSGILFRMPNSSIVPFSENQLNLLYFLEGYKTVNDIMIIKNPGMELQQYTSEINRFYQLSDENEFLMYKAMGVVKLYLRDNGEAIDKIMQENGLDSLVLYEVDGHYSAELQYLDINSVVVVVDAEKNIVFLDHQSNGYDINEINTERVRKALLDKISNRLLQTLDGIGFIKEK